MRYIIQLTFLFIAFAVNAQLPLHWTSEFAGRASSQEFPQLIERDASGNIYTVVRTTLNMAVNKYNSSGALMFSAIKSSIDEAKDLIIDNSGNIIVTGINGSSLFITKVNTNGTIAWHRGDLTIFGGRSVAVDQNNNVYVTGKESGLGAIVTTKYSAAGVKQWTKTFVNPNGAKTDYGQKILYKDNHIYVGGIGQSTNNQDAQFFIIKYDLSGNIIWSIEEGGSTGFYANDAVLNDMFFDKNEKLVIIGQEYYSSLSGKMVYLKINTAGKVLKEVSYPATGNVGAMGYLGYEDANYNLYIAGTKSVNFTNDLELVKYDSAGSVIWNKSYSVGNDVEVTSLFQGSNGDIIISFNDPIGSDKSYLISYSPSGNQNWVKTYKNLNVGSVGTAFGDIILSTSVKQPVTKDDHLMLFYGSNGALKDEIYFYGPSLSDNRVVRSISTDDKLFSLIEVDHSTASSSHFIQCSDMAGKILWVDSTVGRASSVFYATKDFLYTGSQKGMSGKRGVYLSKLNINTGNVLWTVFNETFSSYGNITGLAMDDSNHVYISCKGNLAGNSGDNESILFKHEGSNGNKLWGVNYYHPSGHIEVPYFISYHKGNIYVFTYSRIGNPRHASRIIKYNGAGNIIWNSEVTYQNSSGNSTFVIKDMLIDADDNLYYAAKDSYYGYSYLVKVNKSGVEEFNSFLKIYYSHRIGEADTLECRSRVDDEDPLFIRKRDNGNIDLISTIYYREYPFPSGSKEDTMLMIAEVNDKGKMVDAIIDDMAYQTMINGVTERNDTLYIIGSVRKTGGLYDYFILRLDENKNPVDTTFYNMASSNDSSSFCENENFIFVGGNFKNGLGNDEARILAYGKSPYPWTGLKDNKIEVESFEINVYPNPSNGRLFVEIDTQNKGDVYVELFSVNGSKIAKSWRQDIDFGKNTLSFNTDNFENGLYVLRVIIDNKIQTKKVIVSN